MTYHEAAAEAKSLAWEYGPAAGHETHGHGAIYDQQGRDVALVRDGAAHGRLLAAAPELRAALRGCAAALEEAGKAFAANNPRAARPNLLELHAEAARRALGQAAG